MARLRSSTGKFVATLTVASLALVSSSRAQPEPDEPTFDPAEEPGDIFQGGTPRLADDACSVIAAHPRQGFEATVEEYRAYCEATTQQHFIRAREIAQAVLQTDPRSYVAEFVLGFVYHYGEGNAPRAVYHLNRAREQYERRFGVEPRPDAPWGWHASTLRELAFAYGDVDQFTLELAVLEAHNQRYQPPLIAEAAWPLMKLRRFDEARAAADMGEATGIPFQAEVAANARCAIEFEAGDETRSYAACRAALELGGHDPAIQSAVDFTNFSEASRSVFRLDESEEIALESTRAQLSWYGNPYVELAELYLREGRIPESLDMLRQVHPYRLRRPPHVQDADRNEGRRALAEFFVVVGRGPDAVHITERALMAPDRFGHSSRNPAQDTAILALLDRAARRLSAHEARLAAAPLGFFDRMTSFFGRARFAYDAWNAGRQAARAIADNDVLVGSFEIGRANAAIVPPWLIGDIIGVVGSGVAREAIDRARAHDPREGAPSYYDAFEAEAALVGGDLEHAVEVATRALGGLQRAEALLRARTQLVLGEASRRLGRREDALAAYDEVFQVDPGLFVRLDLAVPVRIVGRGSVGEAAASELAWSPRFERDDVGLRVEVTGDAQRGSACLIGASGSNLGCTELSAEAEEGADVFARRLAAAFEREAFSPRIDLSQTDATGLDGSNAVQRGGLEVFGVGGLTDE